jgi:hypothetical protein
MLPGGPVRGNPIPTRFLASIDCTKSPAQATQAGGIDFLEAILGLLKSLKSRALHSMYAISYDVDHFFKHEMACIGKI